MENKMSEYIVVQFVKRSGDMATRLISLGRLKEEGGILEDFFEPGCEDITEIGRVQMLGDTEQLDDCYISD